MFWFTPTVVIVRTLDGILPLVRPVRDKGSDFVPLIYAYATTMRRCQGTTLEAVALRLGRRQAEHIADFDEADDDAFCQNFVRVHDGIELSDSDGLFKNFQIHLIKHLETLCLSSIMALRRSLP